MSEFDWLTIVWAVAVLILVGGALASYRLSWKRSVTFALIWGCIFAAVGLLFNAVGT